LNGNNLKKSRLSACFLFSSLFARSFCWHKRLSLVLFEFTQIYIFSTNVDACAIVRVVYQEANAIDKLIHIKNPLHFFLVRWLFPLFLDFVQQVARYVFY
jgi:hypothetical protein